MSFITENFLLHSKPAQKLYFDFAEKQPIIDYHNHLSPQEIAENTSFPSITEIWLKHDHYKWRAMRANGIDEAFITGDRSDEEKFCQWATTMPYTIRNPLYHWTQLELKRYFGIDELLTRDNWRVIFDQCNHALSQPEFTPRSLLRRSKVKVLCTTDDPSSNLEFHQMIREQGIGIQVRPTFRPDQSLHISKHSFGNYITDLSTLMEKEIRNASDLIEALAERAKYFNDLGCFISDHGLSHAPSMNFTEQAANQIFSKRMTGHTITEEEEDIYVSYVLYHLGLIYHKMGWTQQLHLGPQRNNSSRIYAQLGSDMGCDSIGDYRQSTNLAAYLDALDKTDQLPRTILYNLNPSLNEVFSTMAGNFNDGSIPGKVQWGPAWWFADQKTGIENHLNALSNAGLLSRFLGMVTDSRSLLSMTRHEYFRRILCNLIGNDIENGELPNDITWLGQMIENICYRNARQYFDVYD
ncbi:MAG: glucuronate isomerase [Reichenbachiella sp.]|uniref:glucuronate isomerase n=2 Tax=Reichenbachiella sp. TaxID=2184521 RepID=UPI0032660815